MPICWTMMGARQSIGGVAIWPTSCSAPSCVGLRPTSLIDRDETLLEMVERQIAECEARIARQKAIIEEMDRDNHPNAAATGRRVS